MKERIYLSPPHMGGEEMKYIKEAFDTNYIAPVGPQLEAFEKEFIHYIGSKFAVSVASGTAALHLALRYLDIGPNDEVVCSTLTFVASANPILYLGAKPIFIDSEEKSWNMDPTLLSQCLKNKAENNKLPKAVVVVHLYGQSADMDQIKEICDEYNVPIVEDAAEALGASYRGKSPGTFGKAGIFSFNGNKIITTSGGGMLVSDDKELVDKCRFWATQARDDAVHYEHSEPGYNYRMSNILAAIGLGQLKVLDDRVVTKRKIFEFYEEKLGDMQGVTMMPETAFGRSTRWLTCMLIDPKTAGFDRNKILNILSENNIESRPAWKPLHLQPVFAGCERFGGNVSERIFNQGICLPCGTNLSNESLEEIRSLIHSCWD